MCNPRLLRQARLESGLTLREVGNAAGLDASSIAHYEAERARPSDNAAKRWRMALLSLVTVRQETLKSILPTLTT